MRGYNKNIEHILDSIEKGQLSAEEGFRMIKNVKADGRLVDLTGKTVHKTVYFNEYLEKTDIQPQKDKILQEGCILFFCDSTEIIRNFNGLAGHLGLYASKIVTVKPGNEFSKISENEYRLDFKEFYHYRKLLDEMESHNLINIVYYMSSKKPMDGETAARFTFTLDSMFLLTKAISEKEERRRFRMMYVSLCTDDGVDPLCAAVGSFAKCAVMENGKLSVKTLEFKNTSSVYPDPEAEIYVETVLEELGIPINGCEEIIYKDGVRYVRRYQACDTEFQGVYGSKVGIKKNGVYIITGGARGIGKVIAMHLARKERVNLVLCGRSVQPRNTTLLEEIKALGSDAIYIKADVSFKDDVERLVNEARRKYGRIDGVIHCAGVIRDSLIVNKTMDDFKAVLTPKINGTVYLDMATRRDRPDLFILFSSIVAVTGNIGQCDYAAANRFMDEYVLLREKEVKKDGLYGLSASVNWPLWEEGSMKPEDEGMSVIKAAGLVPMPSGTGVSVFDDVLAKGYGRLILGYGDTEAVKSFLLENKARPKVPVVQDKEISTDKELFKRMEDFLKKVFSELFKIPVKDIDSQTEFREYGIDSILIRNFNRNMEQKFGNISKTLLYEYDNIQELTLFFVTHHKNELERIFKLNGSGEGTEKSAGEIEVREENPCIYKIRTGPNRSKEDDIAVIGVSGRYPMADNVWDFWDNLKNGRDCITEIPAERWNIDEYYHPDPALAREGKMYCKWGSFLKDVDKFDPLFFNISPREAELMDPQERKFLEIVWELLEDSGYTMTRLRELSKGEKGANVGVFVGVTSTAYQLWGPDEWKAGRMVIPNSLQWSLANRVSYFFNFRGPSMPVDTACSASLTAVHLACESLKREECEMAIAGGINLYLHPFKYIHLCQMRMLSPSGRCHAFGEKGDGFVPGEGGGAVLLKPLTAAIRDNDRIWAVIKSTSVNHGGITSGYTVPNPNAQAALIRNALNKAGISARSIRCIEAHGTGTFLGDPIEISALTKAFGQDTEDRQFCSIGSVKSNIGHLESAAGIAGLTKLILQLKYRTLVPSLHSERLNPNIDFDSTPFYVQHKLEEWKRPEFYENGKFITCPRRAGINSFGAGGSNAHVILEEYEDEKVPVFRGVSGPQLMVLSARNEERLREYALKLAEYLEKRRGRDMPELADIAYTLRESREAMEQRLAAIVWNVEELLSMLKRYGSGETDIDGLYTGNAAGNGHCDKFSEYETADAFPEGNVSYALLEQMAKQWCSGAHVNWKMLTKYNTGRLVSLPTYPFEKRRCWFDGSGSKSPVHTAKFSVPEKEAITENDTANRDDKFPGDSMSVLKPLAEKYTGNAVRFEVKDSIALVVMQDKKNKNMFTRELHLGLLNAFMKIERNPDIKAVILTGYDNIFCMGGTKEQLENISDRLADCSDTEFAYRGLLECKVPVIAAMQGHAVGGGLILGLFADIVIMANECVYSANFVRYGFTPGVGSTFILKDKMGTGLAYEMMFTAKSYCGEELRERGVNLLFRERSEVLNTAFAIAEMLAKKPRATLEILKRELADRTLKILPSVINSEIRMHRQVFSRINAKENINEYFRTFNDDMGSNHDLVELTEKTAGKKEIEETKELKKQEETDVLKTKGKTADGTADKEQSLINVKQKLIKIICEILHVSENEVSTVKSFKELGVDSISGVEIIRDVNKAFNIQLDAVVIYDYSTVSSLSSLIEQEIGKNESFGMDGNPDMEKRGRQQDRDDILEILKGLKDKKYDIDVAEKLLGDVQ